LQQHNQRLEFLGDAVLQLVITGELYQKFPLFGEGPLTQARAQMVNRTSLAAQGRRLKLGDYLILSRGEETTGGRARGSTLADAFEAIIGAVFLDAGYEMTGALILRLFRGEFGELVELPNLTNPKGELQEFLQAKSPEPPHYDQVSVTGPDHVRQFECAVFHGGVELARGVGPSKKLAESAAALEALRRLKAAAPANASTPTA
jgi:ribonuclease-3